MLAFAHIEKCAGTTLKRVLRRNFGWAFCEVRPLVSPMSKEFSGDAADAYRKILDSGANPNVFGAADLRIYQRIAPWVRCIAGHSIRPCLGLQRVSPGIRFVTILREPVSRYVSYYTYGTGSPRRAWPYSFEEYLRKPNFHNFQTKKLACLDDLDLAIRTLEDSFVLVGTMDVFDEFLVLLRHKMGEERFDIGYQSLNVQRHASTDFADRYGDLIEENNSLDIELYRYVRETLLPRQRESYGGDLTTAVAEFKLSNSGRNRKTSSQEFLQKLIQRFYYDTAAGVIRRRGGLSWGGPY